MIRSILGAFIFILLASLATSLQAQEFVGHIDNNPLLVHKRPPLKLAAKTTATLSLPFFEDFTGYGIFPDSSKWADFSTYVNNTMGVMPVSRGVVTFDALNSRGLPYDSFSNSSVRYADSLTCKPIDLSGFSPSDSVYLSFFYQPQGNGFYPLPQDSLMLYLKTRYGGYIKVWTMPGTPLKRFQQVMIPIADSLFFHDAFQFRFVNKAALYWADAVWNVDYIRLNSGRTASDTAVGDVGFTSDPSFLLNDYAFMPYRQFLANPSGERTAQIRDSVRNNYSSGQPVTSYLQATAINTGTVLQAPVSATATVPGYSTRPTPFPSYTTTIPMSSVTYHEKVVFENKFYIESVGGFDPLQNDTVVKNQVFDNYLAYDDGTAEKSYYLNLYPTLPGKIAIEHHINQPDTMQGLAIYFGRQIPFAFYKTFTIKVYSALQGVNGSPVDVEIYSQDFCNPAYADTVNHFWVYKFDAPLPLPAGTFYAGTMQPAESGSDSLYFGLDVNRIGTNHAYYNVLSSWNPSLISGAIMMRPLLGQPVSGTGISTVAPASEWSIAPNPAKDFIQVKFKGDHDAQYIITDMRGSIVARGPVVSGNSINVASLPSGVYIVRLVGDSNSTPRKFIKL